MKYSKDKTILFIMPRLPFPSISGRKTSLYHYCRILSEELGYRLVVASFLEHSDDPSLKPKFIDRLVILDKPSSGEKIKSILIKSFIQSQYPLQVSLFYNKNVTYRIKELVEEEKPVAVIADMVRCTEYIKNLDCFTIADLDDRISLRYKRQLESDVDSINSYGAFLGSLPYIAQKIALWKPIKLPVLKKEISLLNKYELSVGARSNATVFVAQKEAEAFNNELGENKAIAIPNGVDTDYFHNDYKPKQENAIAFLGAMNVAHNENAVLNFINNIYPRIKSQINDVVFYVIGGGVTERLKGYESKDIRFTGRVEDVREYLQKCKVFVCPMTFGSGIKTKNLEAMSFSMPVVTTSVGAENINAKNGEDWFVEDDNDKFAHKVCEILSDSELEKKIGTKAREFILENFSWNVAREQFEKLLRDK